MVQHKTFLGKLLRRQRRAETHVALPIPLKHFVFELVRLGAIRGPSPTSVNKSSGALFAEPLKRYLRLFVAQIEYPGGLLQIKLTLFNPVQYQHTFSFLVAHNQMSLFHGGLLSEAHFTMGHF